MGPVWVLVCGSIIGLEANGFDTFCAYLGITSIWFSSIELGDTF
jgi:hypothetical protein